MSTATLTVRKHERGEYEIGLQTGEGTIVATVWVNDDTSIARRTEDEREDAALRKAARLARTFSAVLG